MTDYLKKEEITENILTDQIRRTNKYSYRKNSLKYNPVDNSIQINNVEYTNKAKMSNITSSSKIIPKNIPKIII